MIPAKAGGWLGGQRNFSRPFLQTIVVTQHHDDDKDNG